MAMNKLYTEEEVRLIIEGAIQEEREACAKVCENIHEFDCNTDTFYSEIYVSAIRARGNNGL